MIMDKLLPMNIFPPILALVLIAAFTSAGCADYAPLETVKTVDLFRYAGTWFEIGSLPKYFQKGCSRTTATYRPRPDGALDVQNMCAKDGKKSSITGKAWVPDENEKGKLKVRFFWPFSGDYWILALDEDYRYAMVGSPDRQSLWILSRKPVLDETIYQELLAKAKSQGFDVGKVEKTPQAVR